ncbi:hypothetical protein D3C86_1565170 [compost metagenome]
MLFVAAAIAFALSAQDASASPEPMKCEVGPVSKAYGGSEWLVYGCTDDRTLVFVSAPGSPAMPFWFMSTPSEDGYRLYGEGNGSQDATRPAYDELTKMTEVERDALLTQTKAVAAVPTS